METATVNPKTSISSATSEAPLTPEHIMKIGMGFWASKVLLTAVEFELFTRFAAQGPMTAAQVRKSLGLHCSERNVLDFLDALASLGFLHRQGLLAAAKYDNGPETAFFLDKKKPAYIGGILEMANSRLYGIWANLANAMRTGKQQNEAVEGEDFFAKLYSDQARLREFARAMSGVQMGAFTTFVRSFDFSKAKTLLDLGGSDARLSLMVAKQHPHMTCISFDLPPVQPIAHASIVQSGLGDRVTAAAGDFFTDTLPKADVITMGNILHVWSEEKKIALMRKAYDALPPGGAFVVLETIIDDDRRQSTFGFLMSLNMLMETQDGFNFTVNDFKGWAETAGFKRVELIPPAGPNSAAVAYK